LTLVSELSLFVQESISLGLLTVSITSLKFAKLRVFLGLNQACIFKSCIQNEWPARLALGSNACIFKAFVSAAYLS